MLTQLRQIGDRLGHLLLGDSRGIAPVPVALAALELVDRNGNPVIDTWKAGGALWTAPGATSIPRESGAAGALVWDFALVGPHIMVRRSTDGAGQEFGSLPALTYADGRAPIVPPVGSLLTLTLWNDASDFTSWTVGASDSALLDADTDSNFQPTAIPYSTAYRYQFQVLEDADGIRRLYTRGSQVQTLGTLDQGIQAGGSAIGDMRWRASLALQPGWLRCNGQALNRGTYSNLFEAITLLATGGTRTNGSPIITGLATTAGMGAGMAVEGSAIPAGTTILIVHSGSQLTLSANCTASATGSAAVRAYPFGDGDGSMTFEIPDLRGRVAAGYDPGNSQTLLGSLDAGIFGKTGGVTTFGTLNLTGGSGVTGVNAATSDNVQPTMILAAEIYAGVVA